MKRINLANSVVVCICAMISCFLWGSAFPFIKIGYKLFDISASDRETQVLFAGIRFMIAGLMVIAYACISSRSIVVPRGRTIKRVAVLSLFQTILQYFFFYIGLANTTGVKASIIEGANVFIAILVAVYVFRQEELTMRKMLGCIVGFAGVVLVNIWGKGFDLSFRFTGEGFILISTVAYAFSSGIIKYYSKEENTVMLSGYQFLFGGFVMTVAGAVMGGHIDGFNIKGILVLLYLAFISAAAYTLWSILLKYNQVSKVAVYGFMNPVFGVILSSILLSEDSQIGVFVSVMALVLVSAGIIIINMTTNRVGGEKKI